MKIAINKCFGGFSLSPLAVKMISERKGIKCFFFKYDIDGNRYNPVSVEDADKAFMWSAYSVPNPQDYRLNERDEDGLYCGANKRSEEISISSREMNRSDKDMISVIEEIGEKASGKHARIEIITIPNNVEWEVEEYDGLEHIAEKHRTWGQ